MTDDDVVGRVERLSALRQSGDLTEREFNTQKAAILAASEVTSNEALGSSPTAVRPPKPASVVAASRPKSRPQWVLFVGCAVALVVALIAVAVFPTGPNVSKAAIERSVLTQVERDAPPSKMGGVKSFACTHGVLTTARWNCKLHQDVSLLPDVNVAYKVTVKGDGCWAGRSDGGSNPSGSLLPAAVHACIGREPKLRQGLLIYRTYDECMRDTHDAGYCGE